MTFRTLASHVGPEQADTGRLATTPPLRFGAIERMHVVGVQNVALCGLELDPSDLYGSREAGQRVWDSNVQPRCRLCERALLRTSAFEGVGHVV